MIPDISADRPAALRLRTHQIILEDLIVEADIGFHDFEIGHPQRLLISIWATIDLAFWPQSDSQEASWDYDFIRNGIFQLVAGRHFNLQETLAEEIFRMIAARPEVTVLRIYLRKPDVYPDAASIGILLSSES